MYNAIVVALCAFLVAFISLPIWFGVGRRSGSVAALVTAGMASFYLFACGGLEDGSRHDGQGEVVLVMHHEHGVQRF